MLNKYLYFLLGFFTLSLGTYGQGKLDSNFLPLDPTLYDLVLFSEAVSSALLYEPKIASSQTDEVFIAQVGEGNSSNVKISAKENFLTLAQLGDGNFTSINVNVRNFDGNVLQNGNRNYSFTLVNDPAKDLKLEVGQNGNDNRFVSHGTNSIGNKLEFDISGDQQTVIVRNFK